MPTMQITTKTNHFGPVLLTLLLLDVVKKSAPSRLIWVGSPAEAFGSPDWTDLKYGMASLWHSCSLLHDSPPGCRFAMA